MAGACAGAAAAASCASCRVSADTAARLVELLQAAARGLGEHGAVVPPASRSPHTQLRRSPASVSCSSPLQPRRSFAPPQTQLRRSLASSHRSHIRCSSRRAHWWSSWATKHTHQVCPQRLHEEAASWPTSARHYLGADQPFEPEWPRIHSVIIRTWSNDA